MGFFDTEEGVREYLEMAKGHDGRKLIEKLSDYLPADSTILELGMGPGNDLEILSKRYEVTGSDNSNLFIDRYRRANPEADLMLLDAVTLKTDRRFDCLFSNKVLHHLQRADLKISIPRQAELLEDGDCSLTPFGTATRSRNTAGCISSTTRNRICRRSSASTSTS